MKDIHVTIETLTNMTSSCKKVLGQLDVTHAAMWLERGLLFKVTNDTHVVNIGTIWKTLPFNFKTPWVEDKTIPLLG